MAIPNDTERKGTSSFGQAQLLLIKTWTCKKRAGKYKIAEEILFPVAFLFVLALITWKTTSERDIQPADGEERDAPQNILHSDFLHRHHKIHVAHYNKDYAKKITDNMAMIWHAKHKDYPDAHHIGNLSFKFHAGEDALNKEYKKNSKKIPYAVILYKQSLSYAIRSNPDLKGTKVIPEPYPRKAGLEVCRKDTNRQIEVSTYLQDAKSCPINGYFYSGFLSLQYLVDQALIVHHVKDKHPGVYPNITMQNYPKPRHDPQMTKLLRYVIPVYLAMSFIPFISSLLVLMVTEKENKIKDGLKLIGVSESAYWVSYFELYFGIMMIVCMGGTIIIRLAILQDTNPIIIFILTFLYGLSLITFSFAITPFFHQPKTAASAASYLLTILSLIHLIITLDKKKKGYFWLMPLKLINTVAFTTAIESACDAEFIGGIGWRDLSGRGEPILSSIAFLIFDIFLYGFIAYYLDNIIPNEYGVRQKPMYCCRRLFCWRCCVCPNKQPESLESKLSKYEELPEDDNMEEVPEYIKERCVIKIRDIKKTYGSRSNSVYALNGISMDIYEGQITAILGRNGAGKSTLINILTGGLNATSGKSIMFGMEMSNPNDMAHLRKMTGVCMQQDLHFEKLTVLEHLEFYGKMRGLESGELSIAIESLLSDLRLVMQKDEPADKLSAGQKRKLSVAIALIGSPKFILLDEPTAGIDPLAKRTIWSLLQSRKRGKVILLTTHHMDEADILADRKAIIHEGVVKCMGSSLFLKRRFGIGYHLTIQLEEKNPNVQHSDAIVARFVPEAVSSREYFGKEAKYRLPQYRAEKFGTMFRAIEAAIVSRTGITNFGISLTTLEEVFLKISSGNLDLESNDSDDEETPMPHRQRVCVNPITSTSPSVDQRDSGNSNTPSSVDQRDGGNSNTPSSVEQNGLEPPTDNNNDNPTSFPDKEENATANLIPFHVAVKPSTFRILWAIFVIRLKIMFRSYFSLILVTLLPAAVMIGGFEWLKLSKTKLVEAISFCVGKHQYGYSITNLAYHTESTKSFKKFIKTRVTKMTSRVEYSGDFRDLLDFHETMGTFAAVAVGSAGPHEYNMRTNGTFLHSPVLALNLLSQYDLHHLSGGTAGSINITHNPFHSKHTQHLDSSTNSLILMGTIFMYVANLLIMEIVKDREMKIRNHLRVNGVSFLTYFVPIFFVYFFVAVFNVMTVVGIVFAIYLKAFTNTYAVTTMVFLLVLCIFPTLLFTTAFSYFFDKTGTAHNVFINFSFIGTWLCHFLRILLNSDYNDANSNLIFICIVCSLNVFYTPFAIFTIMIRENVECDYLGFCSSLSFKHYWTWETIALIIIMSTQTLVYFLTTYFADFVKNDGIVPSMIAYMKPKDFNDMPMSSLKEDLDVTVEKARVAKFYNSGSDRDQEGTIVAAAVQNVWKSYPLTTHTVNHKGKTITDREVLQGLSFLVEEGEMFGLLGHNGAGKTTLMKMLTAEEFPDEGRVWVGGYDVKSISSPAFKKLGYCAQHNALWDNITLREHIELYMIVRGVPKKDRSKLIGHFLQGLQIEEDAKKQAKKLSGGTKRKLSYCMSVLGSPKIALLDEPSTGMDVTSKRFLWNTIIATFKEDRGAILTTHAMDEADALCTRIAIIVNGAFVCIGTPQHLKDKFGAGYTLEVKIKGGHHGAGHRASVISNGSGSRASRGSICSINSMRKGSLMFSRDDSLNSIPVAVETQDSSMDKFIFLQKLFPTAKVSEQFGNHVVYLLPKTQALHIADTFEILQNLKETNHIEDYSFGQTTLEQVFIQFSKDHEEEEEEVAK